MFSVLGELATERHEKYESMANSYKRFYAAAVGLAELLDEPDPELPAMPGGDDGDGASGAGGIDLFNPEKEFQYDGEKELFEDEDTRQFYENLPDLRAMLPGVSWCLKLTRDLIYDCIAAGFLFSDRSFTKTPLPLRPPSPQPLALQPP